MSGVNLDLEKDYVKIKAVLRDTTKRIFLCNEQLKSFEKTKQHALCAETKLLELGENTKMYKQIGRFYILTPPDEIISDFKQIHEEADKKIKILQKKRTQWVHLSQDAKMEYNELREKRQ